ncbi:MAG TPA: hypothetical protein VFM18_08535 [Methanosarcina sp.]|nr:hypothetical protein [Methanosarcina sp.]
MAIKASFSYDAVSYLSSVQLRRLVVASLEEALKYWKDEIQKEHFKDSAVTRYGYQKRSKGYQIKKARKTGQTAPLVYSGDSKRMALASNKITKSGNIVTLSIRVPDYIVYVRKSNPDLAKELTTVTDEELKLLYDLMEIFLNQKLSSLSK